MNTGLVVVWGYEIVETNLGDRLVEVIGFPFEGEFFFDIKEKNPSEDQDQLSPSPVWSAAYQNYPFHKTFIFSTSFSLCLQSYH